MEAIFGLGPAEPPSAVARRPDSSAPPFARMTDEHGRRQQQMGGMEGALRLAMRCSHRRRWEYALLKLFESISASGRALAGHRSTRFSPLAVLG
jgi:hypothetical protein